MDQHDVKNEVGYLEILNEEIERKLNRAETYKKFISYMTNHEETLDCLVIPPSFSEEQKRRKKASTISYVESIRLDDEEIVKDLNSISKDPSANIRVLDNILYVRSHRLVKGDKVVIKSKKEEYVATLTGIDEDEISIKSKENKRLRISLDDFKKHLFSINRWTKK